MPIRIREIEKKLFSYLFINKVATSLHLQRDIYPEISHQALYKRLNQLIKEGFLEADYHRELNGRLVYSLATKSLNDFLFAKSSKEFRRQLKSNSILHDLDLLDIRARLKEKASVKAYYSENLVQSGVELIDSDSIKSLKSFNFDAILKLQKSTGAFFIPVEYERTLKFSSRYRAYFKKIYASPNIEALFFIGKDEKLIQKIRSLEKSVLGSCLPKIFYSTLDQITNRDDSVSFVNQNKEHITLD